MTFDLVLRDARLRGHPGPLLDIGITGGRIAAIEPGLPGGGQAASAGGKLVLPGLVETHIHLDKTCILDRCSIVEGSVKEAISETARAKLTFTHEDILARARRTLEKAIIAGTMHMRTHVEIDPRIGLKGFHAIRALAKEYAWAIDLSICVFPQEGLTNDPGCEELLIEACEAGVDAIGGVPYIDTQPLQQIERIFAIARRFDLDIDFHLDFDLDASWMHIDEVCRQTEKWRWGGRVAAGHMTKLSAIPPERQIAIAGRLAQCGVALTVIPSTDLFLMGRDHEYNVPRGVTRADRFLNHGVTTSLATNNVMNAFTPFGDASLIRMANLFANIAQLGRAGDFEQCLDMVSTSAARLMNLTDYGLSVGNWADLVVIDSAAAANAVAELAQPLAGYKRGRRTFRRPPAMLERPS